jgi:hypothetical protein
MAVRAAKACVDQLHGLDCGSRILAAAITFDHAVMEARTAR